MGNLIQVGGSGTTFVPSLTGIDYGVVTALKTLIMPCNTTYEAAGVVQNAAPNNLTASGAVQGAPTFSTTGMAINTGGTDKVSIAAVNDFGGGSQVAPDFTAFIVIENTAGTPGYVGLSNYGNDGNNVAGLTAAKGIKFSTNSSTSVAFGDFHTIGGVTNVLSVSVTVTGLATGYYMFAFQRGTVSGVVTRSIFNLTAGPAVAPTGGATLTETAVAANNVTQNMYIGSTSGGQGAACIIPWVSLTQSAQGGGAFLTLAQINKEAVAIRAFMAGLGITC